jgi:serine/threonine-protein kinase
VQRGIGVAVGVAGLVGLGVGTVFAVRSKNAHDDSQEYCDGPACRDQIGYQLQIQAIRNGNAATVSLAIGAVGVVTGAVLWFTAPSSTARVGVGPGTVRFAGTW